MSTEATVLVTALIRPHMEARVVGALHDLPDFPGFFITRVRGRGAGGTYLSTESELTYHEFVKIELICPTALASLVSKKIVEAAWTGRKGDGVVFTVPAFSFGRIRELGDQREATT